MVRLVHRCVQASGVRCILRVRHRLGRVRLELVRGFRRRGPFVRAVVREGLRAGRDNATFRVE